MEFYSFFPSFVLFCLTSRQYFGDCVGLVHVCRAHNHRNAELACANEINSHPVTKPLASKLPPKKPAKSAEKTTKTITCPKINSRAVSERLLCFRLYGVLQIPLHIMLIGKHVYMCNDHLRRNGNLASIKRISGGLYGS